MLNVPTPSKAIGSTAVNHASIHDTIFCGECSHTIVKFVCMLKLGPVTDISTCPSFVNLHP